MLEGRVAYPTFHLHCSQQMTDKCIRAEHKNISHTERQGVYSSVSVRTNFMYRIIDTTLSRTHEAMVTPLPQRLSNKMLACMIAIVN